MRTRFLLWESQRTSQPSSMLARYLTWGVMMKGMTMNLDQPVKTAQTVLEDSVTSMRVVTDIVSYVLTSTLLSNVIMMGFQRRVPMNVAMYVSMKTAQEELFRRRNQLSCIFTVLSQPCMAKVGSLLLPVRVVSPPPSAKVESPQFSVKVVNPPY